VLPAKKTSNEQVGQFRLIEGNIHSIDKDGWGFYLDKIHVSIPKNIRKRFKNEPTFRIEQSLTVRGKLRISSKGNVFMAVYTPEDLEVNP